MKEPTILFSQKGIWKVKIGKDEFNINSKDTFSVPLNTKVSISIENNEDCYLNCVSKSLMKGFDKKYKDFPDFILKITKQIWEGKDVESIAQFYTDDIPVRSPFGITYGNKPVIEATYNTLKEFPNRQLLGEDVIWNGNDENGYHSSHRILSKGNTLR